LAEQICRQRKRLGDIACDEVNGRGEEATPLELAADFL